MRCEQLPLPSACARQGRICHRNKTPVVPVDGHVVVEHNGVHSHRLPHAGCVGRQQDDADEHCQLKGRLGPVHEIQEPKETLNLQWRIAAFKLVFSTGQSEGAQVGSHGAAAWATRSSQQCGTRTGENKNRGQSKAAAQLVPEPKNCSLEAHSGRGSKDRNCRIVKS